MTYLVPGVASPERQQLSKLVVATADQNGNATFVFELVPPGYNWAGNVQVANAPPGAMHVVSVADVNWGTMVGSLPMGTVLIPARLALTVTSVGLLPFTDYTATLLGVSDVADALPPILPTAQPSSIAPTTTFLTGQQGALSVAAGNTIFGPFATSGLGGVVVAVKSNVLGLGGPVLVFVEWTDQPQGQMIAKKDFIVAGNSSGTLRMPVYAPYFTITATLLSGTTAQVISYGITEAVTAESWSDAQSESILLSAPATTNVLADGSLSMPTGTTSVVASSSFTWSGPARVYASLNAAGATANVYRFDFMDNTGTYINKFNYLSSDVPGSVAAAPGLSHVQFDLQIPARPWQIRLTNNSGGTALALVYIVGDYR
jgi:hypothetical protein